METVEDYHNGRAKGKTEGQGHELMELKAMMGVRATKQNAQKKRGRKRGDIAMRNGST